ncbi:MAG: hypothetical protein HYX87_02080 [Chloroflexi bacterium]|nr:hypothetical protein [Chloroflexota bacterium]
MNLRSFKVLIVSTVVVLLGLVGSGCSGNSTEQQPQQTSGGYTLAVGGKSPIGGTSKENSQGPVTVSAQWMGEKNGSLVFSISMNTHSVNLDVFDLSKLAVLVDDSGKNYAPISWLSEPGGHHRSGTLAFPIPDTLKQGQAKYIKMDIKDIAGAGNMVFKWDL